MTLQQLYRLIQSRKKEMPQNSYVASLFLQDNDRLIQKVGEEAIEVMIAAKNNDRQQLISEAADLIFHLLVMFVLSKITLNQVLNELASRNKLSKNQSIN